MKTELVLGNLKRERDALDGKMERLESALAKEWQDAEQEYLCTQQYNAMCLYAHILDERIADLEDKLDQKRAEKIMDHETSHDDEGIYNKKINLDGYKECANNTCKTIKFDCDDPEGSFIEMFKSIFGVDISR